MAKATDHPTSKLQSEQIDEYMRTLYAAATPAQRAILYEVIERVVSRGETIDELSVARFRRRFGKVSPQLRSALDALEYRQALERARPAAH